MEKNLRRSALLLSLSFLAACSGGRSMTPPTPLVDGACDQYPALRAETVAVSDEVRLHLFQDDHYVWMCYAYPPGSFATMDLQLATEGLAEPMNLHVSAQLGEWPVSAPELAPTEPTSDRWWNATGWTANPVWVNGMDTTGARPRYRFKNANAREIQIAKARFGTGTWQFTASMRQIKRADGSFYDLDFPDDGTPYRLRAE